MRSIRLINGRGQLGVKIKEALNINKKTPQCNVLIYHTWNVGDKSKKAQLREYDKFTNFVDRNQESKIIFISTTSQKETFYSHYKQLAEAYLISNCKRGLTIRFPTFIGKGSCNRIKHKEIEAYGRMELITLNRAANEVLNLIDYEGMLKAISICGEQIEAETVASLLHDS